MDCSMPGFPVFPYLLEFAQTHVRWVSDVIQPSHPLLPPSPPALNLSQHLCYIAETEYRVLLGLCGPRDCQSWMPSGRFQTPFAGDAETLISFSSLDGFGKVPEPSSPRREWDKVLREVRTNSSNNNRLTDAGMLGHAHGLRFIWWLPGPFPILLLSLITLALHFPLSQVSSVWAAKTGQTIRWPHYTQLWFYSREQRPYRYSSSKSMRPKENRNECSASNRREDDDWCSMDANDDILCSGTDMKLQP